MFVDNMVHGVYTQFIKVFLSSCTDVFLERSLQIKKKKFNETANHCILFLFGFFRTSQLFPALCLLFHQEYLGPQVFAVGIFEGQKLKVLVNPCSNLSA